MEILSFTSDQLLSMEPEDFWSFEGDHPVKVECEDGVVWTTLRRIQYIYPCWGIIKFINEYYQLKDDSEKFHIKKEYIWGLTNISADTHSKIIGKIYWHIYHAIDGHMPDDSMLGLCYYAYVDIHNNIIQYMGEYVDTLDFEDILEIAALPGVLDANENCKLTPGGIEKAYDQISKSILESNIDNTIVRGMRAGLYSPKQVYQTFGPRAFVTEMDSSIYPIPAKYGFAHGLRDLYESMLDSASAGKAMWFQKDPLRDTEYFNRELQLFVAVLERVHKGDCGSTVTIPWKVKLRDLKSMRGMYYLHNGKPTRIEGGEIDLVDKTIDLRTVYGCHHPDEQGVCSTCYGDISLSLRPNMSVGNIAGISAGEVTTQLVLSVKHVDGSADVELMVWNPKLNKYITLMADDTSSFRLTSDMEGKKYTLAFKEEEAPALPDINTVSDVSELNIRRISCLRTLILIIEEDDGSTHELSIPVDKGARTSSFTTKFLQYIKLYGGLYIDKKGRYVVDMARWPVSEPVCKIQLRHVNMIDYMKEVKSLVQNPKSVRVDDPMEKAAIAIHALDDIIHTKLDMNLSHIIAMTYAAACKDPDRGNYMLPKGGESFDYRKMDEIVPQRSMAVSLAYEAQHKPFQMPHTYLNTDRHAHYLDGNLVGGGGL